MRFDIRSVSYFNQGEPGRCRHSFPVDKQRHSRRFPGADSILEQGTRMKKFVVITAVLLTACAVSPSAFATKEFHEVWVKVYVDKSENEDFKKLATEAKCNICHIEGENKKKHNPYGETLEHDGLTKKNFPVAKFKQKPDEVRKEVEEILKKAEEKKAEKAEKTFGERIQEGLLPGGDKFGK
jgi:adenylylsulfate kinase-like enzyme